MESCTKHVWRHIFCAVYFVFPSQNGLLELYDEKLCKYSLKNYKSLGIFFQAIKVIVMTFFFLNISMSNPRNTAFNQQA